MMIYVILTFSIANTLLAIFIIGYVDMVNKKQSQQLELTDIVVDAMNELARDGKLAYRQQLINTGCVLNIMLDFAKRQENYEQCAQLQKQIGEIEKELDRKTV